MICYQKLEDAWKVFAIILTIILFILIIVVIVIAKKINIAIALIEEASSAMLRLPQIIALPFVTTIVIIVFSAWAIFLLAMLGSTEEFTVQNAFDSLTTNFVDLTEYQNCTTINTTGTENAICYSIQFVAKYGDIGLEIFMIVFHLFM